jgi:branched-chain amino acid transport system substrate-binding protein
MAIDANGGNKPTRQQVIDQMSKVNYTGLTGLISFNNLGDPTKPVLQIQENKGGTWTFIKQFGVGG